MKKLREYSTLEESFDGDIFHICYYMKGSISKEEAWMLTRAEAKRCSTFIKETRKEELEFAVQTSGWGLF